MLLSALSAAIVFASRAAFLSSASSSGFGGWVWLSVGCLSIGLSICGHQSGCGFVYLRLFTYLSICLSVICSAADRTVCRVCLLCVRLSAALCLCVRAVASFARPPLSVSDHVASP